MELKISPVKNNRIDNLKEMVLTANPRICTDRAKIITDVFRNNENLPVLVRRAIALREVLKKMKIYILAGELIVGNQASTPRAAPIFPEFSIDWIIDEIKEFPTRKLDRFMVDEASIKDIEEIADYWQGKTHFDRVSCLASQMLSSDVRATWNARSGNLNQVISDGARVTTGDGHVIVNYERVINEGLLSIINDAKKELDQLDLADAESLGKKIFLESVIIALEAAIDFSRRFAEESAVLSVKEKDPVRKAELEKISNICHRVPAYPANTFHEAMQSYWFIHLIIQIESNGHSISFGRFDQYLYPFLKNDLEEGRITEQEALELTECFWIKCNELNKLREKSFTLAVSGYTLFQSLTIGGANSEGDDATNDLSYLCLKATADLKLPAPTLMVRIHNKTPEGFFLECCKTLLVHGGGLPAFFNDELIIPMLLCRGVSIDDARNWAVVGCSEASIPGKSNTITGGGCFVILPKVLELALNNGINPKNGSHLCPGSGDLASFPSFEKLIEEYKKQLSFYVSLVPILDNITASVYEDLTPTPFLSSLVDGRIQYGKDLSKGGGRNYSNTIVQGHGVPNVGNSLAAIKKIVFEEKKVSAKDLKLALENNFEGIKGKRIHQMLLNKVPKYGNDDPYVDNITAGVAKLFFDEVMKYRPYRGGIYGPTLQTVASNVPDGAGIGATPDGRKDGEPLADNVSPTPGTDRNGPTAVLKSVARIDHLRAINGTILNLRFHPSLVKWKDLQEKKSMTSCNYQDPMEMEGLRNLAAMIKTFFDLKGFQVQINVISSDVLKDAQRHPDEYGHLVVKVAGYSAYFTQLDKKLQDQIIARTEYSL